MFNDQLNNGKITWCIALIACFVVILGCSKGNNIPSVDHLDGSFNMVRFEQELWSMNSTSTDQQIQSKQEEHTAFWTLYFEHILPLTQVIGEQQSAEDAIRGIVSDPRLRFIADTVAVAYSDMSDIEEELRDAFRYFQYYFPGNRAPNVYTLISDFGFFPFIFEDEGLDAIGISLEMFMGAGFPYREFIGNHPAFSDYLLRTHNRDHITKKVVDVMIDDILGPPPGERLLDLMIHNGKKLYILQQLLPTHSDTILLEYTPDQVAWCEANERNLWAHFLTEELLYSNEFSKINKLVNYSPNVPGLPSEATGRVANWTGWRIIQAWKESDPDLSLIDIIALRDAQRILELARYKPR